MFAENLKQLQDGRTPSLRLGLQYPDINLSHLNLCLHGGMQFFVEILARKPIGALGRAQSTIKTKMYYPFVYLCLNCDSISSDRQCLYRSTNRGSTRARLRYPIISSHPGSPWRDCEVSYWEDHNESTSSFIFCQQSRCSVRPALSHFPGSGGRTIWGCKIQKECTLSFGKLFRCYILNQLHQSHAIWFSIYGRHVNHCQVTHWRNTTVEIELHQENLNFLDFGLNTLIQNQGG
jgi:hypothetical protein